MSGTRIEPRLQRPVFEPAFPTFAREPGRPTEACSVQRTHEQPLHLRLACGQIRPAYRLHSSTYVSPQRDGAGPSKGVTPLNNFASSLRNTTLLMPMKEDLL